ncbi:MAG: CCA tRNA nucleotidyltransferase [Lachnospiraceae bacterium]
MELTIKMPENAAKIIHTLQAAGFEAYIVGGCVRDAILGRNPDDWDITTSATPKQVKALFKRTVDTGIAHGTVTVVMKNNEWNQLESYEVTTYRVDGKYEDHRRPKEVTFTASLIEDMKRRDFTINAMAYNDKEGVIDHFGGISDLQKRVIRCVGNPAERFDEDALRILRGVRFAAQLDFTIDSLTKEAIRNQAVYLKDISAERIHVELTKLLVSKHPEQLQLAYELGVTKVVLPEFDKMMETEQNNPHHCYNVGMHTLCVVQNVKPTETMRWAALLHDVAKPVCKTSSNGKDHFYGHNVEGEKIAKAVLKRLKFDNDTIQRVTRLVYWHDYGMGGVPSMASFRKSLNKMGKDLFEDYVDLKRADILGQSDYMRNDKLEKLQVIKDYYKSVLEEKQCVTVKELAVTGNDLIELGMKPGKELGNMLTYLLEQVLERPELNDKNTLLKLTMDKLKQ